MLFRSKKPEVSRAQALTARPIQLAKCELVETPDGGARLKVPLRPTKWAGRLFRMPEGATKTFELDSVGLFVWNHCDGKTTVQQLIRKLAREHKLTLREVEVATIRFLQMLVKKGLIGMSVEKKEV